MAPTAAPADEDLTVASLNIRYGYDGDGKPRPIDELEAKLRRLLTGTSRDTELPDQWVLGLVEHITPQEGKGPSVAEQLAARLGARYEVLPLTEHYDVDKAEAAPPGENTVSWGIAVLSNLDMSTVRPPYLGQADGDPTPRYGLEVALRTKGGKPVRVIGAHLTHQFLASHRQVRTLLEHARDNPDPTISFGDWNSPRAVVRRIARRTGHEMAVKRGRTWPVDGQLFIPPTFVRRLPERFRQRRGGPPWVGIGGKLAALDHITAHRAQVVSGQVVEGLGSDHDGLRAVLRVPVHSAAHRARRKGFSSFPDSPGAVPMDVGRGRDTWNVVMR